MTIETEWDRVNPICGYGNDPVSKHWIVQTFDYWVLFTGMTKAEAEAKTKEINGLPIEQRRKFIRDAKGPLMCAWSDPLELAARMRERGEAHEANIQA